MRASSLPRFGPMNADPSMDRFVNEWPVCARDVVRRTTWPLEPLPFRTLERCSEDAGSAFRHPGLEIWGDLGRYGPVFRHLRGSGQIFEKINKKSRLSQLFGLGSLSALSRSWAKPKVKVGNEGLCPSVRGRRTNRALCFA